MSSRPVGLATMPCDDRRLHTVLGKAVAVLDAFTPYDAELNLAEFGRRTGLPKSTLHRMLADLCTAGLLDRHANAYRLSPRLFALGMRAVAEPQLVYAAMPYLEDLYAQTHETVHLGIRDGVDIVYLAKVAGHRQALSPSRIGGRMPLYCTAIGKALLAHAEPSVLAGVLGCGLHPRAPRTVASSAVLRGQLKSARDTGLAFEYEESTAGLACIAAPVRNGDGEVVAAVSITGPALSFAPASHCSRIRSVAAGIGERLRHLSRDSERATIHS